MSYYDLARNGHLLAPGNTADAQLTADLANTNARLAQTAYKTASSAGNVSATLTASAVKGGILTSTPGAAINLTTPTAALLVAADPAYKAVGRGYEVTVINLASATHAITLVAGTGVTLVGSAVVAAATSATFYVSYTNVSSASEAVTIYRLA